MKELQVYTVKRIMSKVFWIFFILIILSFFLIPIYWVASMAFKNFFDIFDLPPKWIFKPTLMGFKIAFNTRPILRWTINSLIISIGGTILSLALGVPAGYCLARAQFWGKRMMWNGILLTRVIPPIVIVLPVRVFMQSIGLFGTQLAVILYTAVFNATFTAWIMSGFFESIPVDIEDMALIDGCSPIGAFWRIALPLCKPGLVTVTLFSFIFTWNDFLGALTLTSPETATLPIGIMSGAGQLAVQWNVLAAICLIAIIPVMILCVSLQRYYVSGLTLGAIK